MNNSRLLIVILLIGATLITSQCGSTQNGGNSQSPTLASDSGSSSIDAKALLQERCTSCHPFNRVETVKKTVGEWTSTVQRMIGHGANLTPQETDAVIKYLGANYSK